MHTQEHQVRILDQLFHTSAEPGACCSINHPVVGTDAEVNLIGFLNTEAIRLWVIVYQLCYTIGLADGNNSSLRAQDSRYKVATADIAYAWHTESAVVEISLGESSVRCFGR